MAENRRMVVFNCGSSSIKFAHLDAVTGQRYLEAQVERIGSEEVSLRLLCQTADSADDGCHDYQHNNEHSNQQDDPSLKDRQKKSKPSGNDKREVKISLGRAGYEEAFTAIFQQIEQLGINLKEDAIAVAHRVVHGGCRFKDTVQITAERLQDLEKLDHLAPLHNPANRKGIALAMQYFPNKPQFMTFDTAFHATIPEYAHRYPLPDAYYRKHDVRRFGFHGTSHRYVSEQAIAHLKLPREDSAIITAHCGNGCSLSAILNGESVDTTMGFTPLDGVMMGTRSGSIDPSIHQYLHHELGISLDGVTHILNKESGLLGVSCISHDMRDLEAATDAGNAQAQLAIDMFCYSISKHIASMSVALGRIDALVFTGGIGEHAAMVREKVLARCHHLGLLCDTEKNLQKSKDSIYAIHRQGGIPVLVITTDEEWQMAREADSEMSQIVQ